jgi:ribosomal 30S subunit maturation factor RimM
LALYLFIEFFLFSFSLFPQRVFLKKNWLIKKYRKVSKIGENEEKGKENAVIHFEMLLELNQRIQKYF